jgi:hypothetical protein
MIDRLRKTEEYPEKMNPGKIKMKMLSRKHQRSDGVEKNEWKFMICKTE